MVLSIKTKSGGNNQKVRRSTTTTSSSSSSWTFLVWLLPLISILVLVGFQVRSSLSFFGDNNDNNSGGSFDYSIFFTNPTATNNNNNINNNNNDDNDDDDEPPSNNINTPLNILIFYPDDWRYDAIGDATDDIVHTPFLTQLAKDGIRFTHNAVTTSICWISRATLFTGRYVSQHQSSRLYCPTFTMPQFWKHTWVSILQSYYTYNNTYNYFVGHVGKWQFHNAKPSTLFNWSSFHEGHHWYRAKGGKKIHAADRARNDAIQFLRERPKSQNFALTVAFYPPKPLKLTPELGSQWEPDDAHKALYEPTNATNNHNYTVPPPPQQFEQPYNYSQAFSYLPPFLQRGYTKERWDTRWKTSEQYQASLKNYYALISHIDDACRDVVMELSDQGLLNSTMIIVTADNGLLLGAHAMGGKWHPYTESIRVPLIVYDPRMAKSKRGTTNDAFTLNIDLAPTILGAAGINDATAKRIMQGRDLADLYVKKKEKQDNTDHSTPGTAATTTTTQQQQRSLTQFGIDQTPWREDFYYEFPLPEFPASTALVTRQYKYIQWRNRHGGEQIFDVQADPYELDDWLSSPLTTSGVAATKATDGATTTTTKQQQEDREALVSKHVHQKDKNNHRNNPAFIQKIRGELKARHDQLERQIQERVPGVMSARCAKAEPDVTPPWP